MAVTISGEKSLGLAKVVRKKRRRFVKENGKRFIRSLSGFLGRQSIVEDAPVLDSRSFPFLRELEANWHLIRAELDHVLVGRDHLPPFQMISRDQKKIARGESWKTFILFGFKYKSERNCAHCPVTTRLLESVPNLQTAMFSILAPGYHIPAHRGITKGLIRVHLGLKMPKDRDSVRMRVDDRICHWSEGECLVFDDTFDHEVWNDTDEERVVLLFDFERPMRLPGRMINRVFLGAIRWTSYVQEARGKATAWEDRFENAVRWADAQHIDSDGDKPTAH